MTITWFTSDNHFFHENIIRLSKRPFASLTEMNDALLQRWNEVVKPKDTIWVLGDFTFRHAKGSVLPFYSQLNGVKHLVRGNHDNAEVLGLPWESVSDYKELNIDGKKLVLSHYPMRSWNGMYRGSIHLYGHEHGNLEDFNNCCDVGVDSWNFYPTSLPQVLDRIGNLPTWVAKTPETINQTGDQP